MEENDMANNILDNLFSSFQETQNKKNISISEIDAQINEIVITSEKEQFLKKESSRILSEAKETVNVGILVNKLNELRKGFANNAKSGNADAIKNFDFINDSYKKIVLDNVHEVKALIGFLFTAASDLFPEDQRAAFEWFLWASIDGVTFAQSLLAQYYEHGIIGSGVKPNDENARFWLKKLAAKDNDSDVQKRLKKLEGKNTVYWGFNDKPKTYYSSYSSTSANTNSSSGCYLTSACMKVKKSNFDDNCYELTTLRKFRDTYVKDNYPSDIIRYYETAPKIISLIDRHPAQNDIYNNMYKDLVLKSIDLINAGNNEETYQLYKGYCLSLERLLGL
jgi:TPR repeat protein